VTVRGIFRGKVQQNFQNPMIPEEKTEKNITKATPISGAQASH
jgi:hypothetical protein